MCNYAPSGNQPDDLYLAIQQQRSPEEAASYLADECRKKDRTIRLLNNELNRSRTATTAAERMTEHLKRRYLPCKR